MKLRRVTALIFLTFFALFSVKKSLAAPEKSSAAHSFVFSQGDFPNLLLPTHLRALPPAQVTPAQLTRAQTLIEQATVSILGRLTVPVPSTEPGNTIRPVLYFQHLESELRETLRRTPGHEHADFKLYASGGVARSALTYLYDLIQKAYERNPSATHESILNEIIHSSDPIPAIQVRGVGSDLDLLIETAPEHFSILRDRAKEITDGAASKFGQSVQNKTLRNGFFTFGDVRAYQEQIERSTQQGGSVVDYLAVDVKGKKLVSPARFPGAFADLVLGWNEFADPVAGANPENPDDTAIRGARTLIEMPWLRTRGADRLRRALRQTLEDLRSGKLDPGSPKGKRALSQFDRMVRNARYGGAHNRFQGGETDSIEALTRAIATLAAEKIGRPSSLIPEFIDDRPLADRASSRAELRGLPRELIQSDPVAFLERIAPGLKVFHGTPTIDNALAILRQGLFVSRPGQGGAVFGRGAYSSPQREVAQGYAGSQGLIFELDIQRSQKLNVLDWPAVKDHPWMKERQADAERRKVPLFQLLAQEHGIDLILHEHLLIQNSAAIRFPTGIRSIAETFRNAATSTGSLTPSSLSARIESFETYAQLRTYVQLSGETGLPELNSLVIDLVRDLQKVADLPSDGPTSNWKLRQDLQRLKLRLEPTPQLAPLAAQIPTISQSLLARFREGVEAEAKNMIDPATSIEVRINRMRKYQSLTLSPGLSPSPGTREATQELQNRLADSARALALDKRMPPRERLIAVLYLIHTESHPSQGIYIPYDQVIQASPPLADALAESARTYLENFDGSDAQRLPDSDRTESNLSRYLAVRDGNGEFHPETARSLLLLAEKAKESNGSTARSEALENILSNPTLFKEVSEDLFRLLRQQLSSNQPPHEQLSVLRQLDRLREKFPDPTQLERLFWEYASDPQITNRELFVEALKARRNLSWTLKPPILAKGDPKSNFQRFFGKDILSKDPKIQESAQHALNQITHLSWKDSQVIRALARGEYAEVLDELRYGRSFSDPIFEGFFRWIELPGGDFSRAIVQELETPQRGERHTSLHALIYHLPKNPEMEQVFIDFLKRNPGHPDVWPVAQALTFDSHDLGPVPPSDTLIRGMRELLRVPGIDRYAEIFFQHQAEKAKSLGQCLEERLRHL